MLKGQRVIAYGSQGGEIVSDEPDEEGRVNVYFGTSDGKPVFKWMVMTELELAEVKVHVESDDVAC